MVATAGRNWRLAPSLVVLMNETDARAPKRSTASDGSIGDAAHASRDSDHNPKSPRPPGYVDAVDITDDDANGCDVGLLAAHLVATRDPRVKYLIHKGTIWKSYPNRGFPAWAPQVYTGPNPHARHLHISINAGARTMVRPWWPSLRPPAHLPKPPTVQEDDDMPAASIIKKADSPEWWLSDGFRRRHILDRAEAQGLVMVGLAKLNTNGLPFVVADDVIDRQKIAT